VSALVASPLARGLFHRAIGESGAYRGRHALEPRTLAASEQAGEKLAASIGASSLADLRAKAGEAVLRPALGFQPWFVPTVDGHVLPKDPNAIYAAGEQARVPLLAGSNADEVRAGVALGKERPTAKRFVEETRSRYGAAADELLKVYPAGSDEEALDSAAALAGDLFLGYATWKWTDVHGRTGGGPVYRYSFDRKIPVAPGTKVQGKPATAADVGARHAGEIEYVFGALDTLRDVPWEAADRKLSDLMMAYWSNFARAGDPNGPGLPEWPRYAADGFAVMHLDVTSAARADTLRRRYETLDAVLAAGPGLATP
jgi:para-nitrobenzyl esterase